MYKNTIVKTLKFKKGVEVSEACKNFIGSLLVKNPEKRLGSIADSLEIINHEWFKGFNWVKLLDKQLEPPYKPFQDEQEWIKNFDPSFTQQNPTDSICHIDPELFEEFQKEFEDFDFEPEEFAQESESDESEEEPNYPARSLSHHSKKSLQINKRRLLSTPKKIIKKSKKIMKFKAIL